MTGRLPALPLDDSSLDLLEQSLKPTVEDGSSSLYTWLDMMSQLGGSDPAAVAEQVGEIPIMRDPQYSPHDLIEALIAEIRRLRAASP